MTFRRSYLGSSNVICCACVFKARNKREAAFFYVVSRGERQEFKFFDQMVQLFGNKYIINSDPVAEDAADGAGKMLHCFSDEADAVFWYS